MLLCSSGHCLIPRPPDLAFSCILGSEADVPVAACLLGFQKTPLELPIAVIHLLPDSPCYQMLADLLLPSLALTVAELPPVVCFHTLVHCIVPVTLDGCPAAAAEAVLPAPSPAQWVVLSGPGPSQPASSVVCTWPHLVEYRAGFAWRGPWHTHPQRHGHVPLGPLGED